MFAFALSLPVVGYLLLLARLNYPPHGAIVHLQRVGLGLLWGSVFAFLSFYVDRVLVVPPQPGSVFLHSLVREYFVPLLWIAAGWYLLRGAAARERALAALDAGGFALGAVLAFILDRSVDAVAFAGIYDAFLYPLVLSAAALGATRLLPLPGRMDALSLLFRASVIVGMSVICAACSLIDLRGLPLLALLMALAPAGAMIAVTELPPERFRLLGS